jgi:hypothetical protein
MCFNTNVTTTPQNYEEKSKPQIFLMKNCGFRDSVQANNTSNLAQGLLYPCSWVAHGPGDRARIEHPMRGP